MTQALDRHLDRVVSYLRSLHTVYHLLAVGVLVRLAALLALRAYPLSGDAGSYHRVATQLGSGVAVAPYWPPGLPAYLSVWHRVLGAGELASQIAMLPLYVGFALLLYKLILQFADRVAANLSILAFTFFPIYVFTSVIPLTQLPAALLLLAITLLVLRLMDSHSWLQFIALGVALGIIVLLRASTAGLVLLLPLYLLVARRRWWALLSLLVALLLVGAWICYLWLITGDFIMVNYANSLNFYYGNSPFTPLYKTWLFSSIPMTPEAGVNQALLEQLSLIRSQPITVQEDLYMELALEHIGSRPDLFLLRTLARVRAYFAFDIEPGASLIKDLGVPLWIGMVVLIVDAGHYLIIGILSITGLSQLNRLQIAPHKLVVVLGIVVLYAAPYWVSFSHPTYHYPVVPLLWIVGSAWVSRLLQQKLSPVNQKRRSRQRVGLWVAFAVFALIQIEWFIIMLPSLF